MSRFIKHLFCGLLAVSVAGCASGTKYSDFKSSIPPLKADTGRIYFYRTAVVGAAIQPDVYLNNVNVGKAVPQGFWYEDKAPGEYKVTIHTEVERKLSFVLDPSQTRYVRLNISIGFLMGHVYGELVEEDKALKELEKCKYVGSALASTP